MDSGKPILWEVGHLKENYWRWIHEPYDGKLRLFESDFFEFFSISQWWHVPLVWMPFVIYFALTGLNLLYQEYGEYLEGFTRYLIELGL